jgi:hypothetical protein
MAVVQGERKNANGAAPHQAPRSVRAASRGLRTTEDLSAFGSLLASDIMTEAVGTKLATAAVRATMLTLRSAEFQYRHNGGSPVTVAKIDEAEGCEATCDPLALREQSLLEELASVRKQRGC